MAGLFPAIDVFTHDRTSTLAVWREGNTLWRNAHPRRMLNPTLTPAKRCSPANSEEQRDAGRESLQGAFSG